MHPVFFKIGAIPIYSYGLFSTLGFLVGVWLSLKEADRLEIDHSRIIDLALICLIAGVIGARAAFVLLGLKRFVEDPAQVFNIYDGGLLMVGGGILAFGAASFYLRKKRLSLWPYMDLAAPAIAAGIILGRIGCFLAGCDYGKPTCLPWAVIYHHPKSLAPCFVPLHPTQLYDALSHLVLFLLLWFGRSRKAFDGQLFWLFVLSHGLLRLVLYQYRGGTVSVEILGGMSGPQFVGGAMAVAAAIMLRNLSRQQAKD